jgi:vitamin B12 transporter
MHKPFLFAACAASLLSPPAAIAADQLAAVVVTATRQATRVNEVIADVTVIEREAIEQAGPATLPELLARQPGLHVVDTGGMGKATSIFMRGTGSTHTLLLVDGMPLGSLTAGSPSLHNLPLSQIERIEILRGPASSLYGSDAIGGVIQVFTRRGEGPLRLNAYAGIGSDNTREAQAGVSGGNGPWSYSFAASRLTTDGFNVAADPLRFRTSQGSVPNSDADSYRNTSHAARIGYRFAEGHELGASVLEASSRSAYDAGGATVDAYNADKTRVHGLQLRNRIGERWTSTLRWGLSEDRSENFAPARTLFATRQTQWTWQNDLRLPVGSLLLAFENVDQAVDSTTAYTVRQRTVRSFIAGYQGSLGAHSWQASLRRDNNSQFGGHSTGSLAYGFRFAAEWQARIASGTSFKAPTFNQLYFPAFPPFPAFGNPSLQPEKARNLEAGLNWERGARTASLTTYDNRIHNLIAASPAGTAENIGRARITGTSLAYGMAQGAWRGDAAIDLMRPVDDSNGRRLQRRPAEMARLSLNYAPATWKAGGEITAVGRRYDTTTQTRAMGGYAVVNLLAAREIARDWTLEGRINNLFDRVYENAWAFAVPGRQLLIGLRYAPR